jgi:hypothetical protein
MAKTVVNTWSKYQKATADRQLRTIGMSSGEVGSGKTRFWLSAPGPILVLSMDKGTEGVIETILAEQQDKQIYVKEYDWNPQDTRWGESAQAYAADIRTQILEDFEFGLANARTVLFDKETDIREVIQYAEFGDPTSGNVKDYGKLNQRYFHMLNRAKSVPGVNVGFIQSMKDEWMIMDSGVNQNTGKPKKSFTKTGKRIRAGWERLDEVIMTEMHHVREGGAFSIEIGKCRQNSSLQDTTLPGMDFADFGTLLIDGTSREEWL